MEKYIRPFLPDRYSKLSGGAVPISSYWIHRTCGCAGKNLTGVKNRFKLRIRSYTDDPEYPPFL